ncbi:MAG: iron ABC transporter permease [Acidimicrobiia bacterium]|nr:iron ABC transporter permease [Acidimicrobiia bacterium]
MSLGVGQLGDRGVSPEALREPAIVARSAQRRAPRWLWIAAAAVLVPAVVPLAFLGARVLGATDAAWQVLFSGRTFELVLRSMAFTTAVTISAAVIGVGAAWLTLRLDLAWRRTFTVLIALPLVIPSYVLALTFLSFFGPRGLFADVTGFGLPSITGFLGAWIVLTLSTYPYVFLIVRSALRRLDPSLEEAARGLGASPWRTFRTITLPQLRPAIAAGSLLVALYTLSDFGAVSLMRFDAFTRVIYAQYAGRIDRTPAAVLAVVLILIALVVLWAEQRSRGRAQYFSRRPSRALRRLVVTGRQRVAAYGALVTIVLAGVGLPVATLTAWLIRGLARGDTIDMRWGAVTGSVTGSLAAALIAMAAAVPVTILTVRYRSRAAAWLDRSVYVVFSIPHITVALAVVFFGAQYLGPLYQSFTVLAIVYATLFLAQATGAAGAALLQVNPHLEEAARGLGRSERSTIREITVPLMWRGLLTGGALVFLTTMKELPATLLLRPTGFDTMAVRIWSTANEFFYARAAAPALLLLAISAIPMYLMLSRLRDPGT